MVTFLQITEQKCIEERYPHAKAKIRLVQHCAVILAIAELMFEGFFNKARERIFHSLAHISEKN